jgi:hypothetical protein
MDVITCVVGVMLFVVIFAVIQARGTNIRMFTPMLRQPPSELQRTLFLCRDGRIRRFDLDAVVADVAERAVSLSFDNVPGLVRGFNRDNVKDGFFSYRLEYDERSGFLDPNSMVSIEISEIPRVRGETAEELRRGPSAFANNIQSLRTEATWIGFLVDTESLNVFREARSIVLDHGFETGWDPKDVEFPYTECLLGCGTRPDDPGIVEGPQ